MIHHRFNLQRCGTRQVSLHSPAPSRIQASVRLRELMGKFRETLKRYLGKTSKKHDGNCHKREIATESLLKKNEGSFKKPLEKGGF